MESCRPLHTHAPSDAICPRDMIVPGLIEMDGVGTVEVAHWAACGRGIDAVRPDEDADDSEVLVVCGMISVR